MKKNRLQPMDELNAWHQQPDPWDYSSNYEDAKRKEILLNETTGKNFKNVLDIGCGQGFITKDLTGDKIWGIDISESAIQHALQFTNSRINFKQGSIFEINKLFNIKFDLVVITGVLYPQYIGNSQNLIYLLIDQILEREGLLISVHINEWYSCRFPYLKVKQLYYDYRQYTHNLEIYSK